MLGLKGTVAGQSLSDSFPTCPCASPVPAVLHSGAVTILPLAAMSGLHISMLEPLKKLSVVCCQHDTQSHQDQHIVPCPSVTHCAQFPAPLDSPGFLAQSIFPLTEGSSRWATCDKGSPLHLTKVPRDVTPPGAAPRMEETTCGMSPMEPQLPARDAQEHMYPPEVWDRALPPTPLRGITPRGAPCPCSQSAFGHAAGSASRLWLSCAGSLTDGWSNAHPRQERFCTSPDM